MDHAELITKNSKELQEQLKQERSALHMQRIKVRNNELKQHHVIAAHRRTIARIMNILKERAESEAHV
jgi:ribosomal protein L29